MIFYRIYLLFIALPLLLTITLLTALITIVGSYLGMGRFFGYYPPKIWARLFCLISFVRVTVHGRENIDKHQSYVFVANHQGAYDIFSIYGYLNHQFRWMMKKELEKMPVIGFSCRMAGQIFVDNRSVAAIRTTMADAENQLRQGMSVVVFPEGARTFTGEVDRFKRGAFLLASEFNLPVVPITIDGAFKVMPRTTVIPRPGHIILTIHRPLQPGPDGHHLQQVMEESRAAILSSL